jgi:hypothetical protein
VHLRTGEGKPCSHKDKGAEPKLRAAEHARRCKGGQPLHDAGGRQEQCPVVELIVHVVKQQQRKAHEEGIKLPPANILLNLNGRCSSSMLPAR